MATENTNNLTPFDWALVAFLDRVRHRLVESKIRSWATQISLEKGSEGERLSKNLAVAFLEEGVSREQQSVLINIFKKGPDSDRLIVIKQLLATHGSRLFNSYNYVRVNHYVTPRLVPIVPGYTTSSSSDAFVKTAQSAGLPFHLNDEYIARYANQCLPLWCGLTPQLVELFENRLVSRVVNIPDFVGDLSIISRHDDFVHKHYSALVALFGGRSSPEITFDLTTPGAFVLTSAIPDSFNRDDAAVLEEIVASWDRSLREEMQPLSQSPARALAPKVCLPPGEETNYAIEDVRKPLLNASSGSGRGDLSLRIHCSDGKGRTSHALSIDFSGIFDAIRGMIPGGPGFDPEFIQATSLSSEFYLKSLDPKSLSKISKNWEDATSIGSSDESQLQGFIGIAEQLLKRPGLIEVLGLETENASATELAALIRNSCKLTTVFEGKRSYRIMILCDGNGDNSIDGPLAQKHLAELLKGPLWSETYPGVIDRLLADLQFGWDKYIYEKGLGIETSNRKWHDNDKIEEVAKAVHNYMEASSAKLLCIFVPTRVYIPDLSDPSFERLPDLVIDAFMKWYLSTPNYWLVQNIASVVQSESIPPRDLFKRTSAAEELCYFSRHESSFRKTRVFLSIEEGKNTHWLSVMAFFGMHPFQIIPRRSKKPTDWEKSNYLDLSVDDDIPSSLLKYYNSRFEDCVNEPAISRCFLWSHGKFRIGRIHISRIDKGRTTEGIKQEIEFRYIGDGEEQSYKVKVSWRGCETVSMGFLACAPDKLLNINEKIFIKKAAATEPNFKDEEFSAIIEKINTKKGITQVEYSKETTIKSIVAIFRILFKEYSLRETKVLSRIADTITHEMKNALPAIDSLITKLISKASPGIAPTARLSPEIKTTRARMSLDFLKFLACAYGSKDLTGDLIPKDVVRVKNAVDCLVDIVATLAIGLAAKRHTIDEDLWLEPLTEFIKASVVIEKEVGEIWPATEPANTTKYRLGFEAIFISVLANCVQHLLLAILEKSKKEKSFYNILSTKYRKSLSVQLSKQSLIITNWVDANTHDENLLHTNKEHAVGTIHSVNMFLGVAHFGWVKEGKIKYSVMTEKSDDEYLIFKTEVQLPKPIFKEGR